MTTNLPKNYVRLCAMMFLQFGIYGLWLPIAGKFLTADPETKGGLGFSEGEMGMIVGIAASLGALCCRPRRSVMRWRCGTSTIRIDSFPVCGCGLRWVGF